MVVRGDVIGLPVSDRTERSLGARAKRTSRSSSFTFSRSEEDSNAGSEQVADTLLSRRAEHFMGIGSGIVVFAVGAILRFAVNVQTKGFNVHTIGVILMIVGAVAFIVSLFFWSSWGGIGTYRRRTVVPDDR